MAGSWKVWRKLDRLGKKNQAEQLKSKRRKEILRGTFLPPILPWAECTKILWSFQKEGEWSAFCMSRCFLDFVQVFDDSSKIEIPCLESWMLIHQWSWSWGQSIHALLALRPVDASWVCVQCQSIAIQSACQLTDGEGKVVLLTNRSRLFLHLFLWIRTWLNQPHVRVLDLHSVLTRTWKVSLHWVQPP